MAGLERRRNPEAEDGMEESTEETAEEEITGEEIEEMETVEEDLTMRASKHPQELDEEETDPELPKMQRRKRNCQKSRRKTGEIA